jgi:GH24 family phage-related lysozyme (muramidase)
LKKDLAKAKDQVHKELGGIKLTPKQEEMFIDFVFNMGTLKKFPKFTEFALKNDLGGMRDQYKRYAGGKELKGRNNEFLKRFLSEYFGFNYYF